MGEVGFISSKLVVRKSPIHGYGVFATDNINKGEMIEKSLKLIIKSDSCETLSDYVVGTFSGDVLMMGYLSIYNHSDDPNIQIEGKHLLYMDSFDFKGSDADGTVHGEG